MLRFAVCHIPPARSPFYRLGTSILGYDIRSQRGIYLANPIRAQIPDFDETFVEKSQKVGFHATLYGAPYCEEGDLKAIVHEIERILNCFSPVTSFELKASSEFVTLWGEDNEIAVLRYDPNQSFLMLHTMLVTQLAPYGEFSVEQQTAQKNPEQFASAQEAYRALYFHSPYLFDNFRPHYTLLYPYKGNEHQKVTNSIQSIFAGFKQHTLESICLLIKEDDDANWKIHKEFHFIDYPQALDG